MLITNAKVIAWETSNRIIADAAIRIQNGLIEAVGPQADLLRDYPDEERLDAGGQYVMPGNICAHTHFYGAYSRGMAIPGSAPEDFPEILNKLWWPLDKALQLEDVYASAMVCLVDAIRCGTTTLIDHHASPNAIDGSLDEIARAVEECGLRAALCYEVSDRDGEDKAAQGIRENVRFAQQVQSARPYGGRLAAMFGLHASLTLSEATLAACRDARDGLEDAVGFHIHVAEHSVDEYDSLAKSGLRVVDRLQQAGILGPRSLVVHAVHVDAREVQLLAESRTWVSHQPRSNMNNGVGLPAVESMLRAGVRVCLGNDGFSNAMWDEWKAAYLAHKLIHRDPRRMGADTIAQMAIDNNRDLVQSIFGGPAVGVIRAGAAADLIFVDYQPYTPLTADNLPWHIVFGFDERMVTTTIAAGRVLMRNRELVGLDEERIAAEALRRAPEVWQRYQRLAQPHGRG